MYVYFKLKGAGINTNMYMEAFHNTLKLAATRVLGENIAKHTVTSSAILLHNPTFNASTAIR